MNQAAEKRRSSGNHPAVKEFRRKLESLADHPPTPEAPKLDELNEDLERYLREVKSDPPGPPKGG